MLLVHRPSDDDVQYPTDAAVQALPPPSPPVAKQPPIAHLSVEYVPAAHSTQADTDCCPVRALARPAGQRVHTVCPVKPL